MNDPARTTALYILNRLDRKDLTLDHLLEEAFEACPNLNQRDRRFLFALVFGAVRWRGLLDWMIDRFSRTPISRMDKGVANLLRLAAFQVVKMDRVPAAAAVTTAVEISKSFAKPHVTRFINGVLRSLCREFGALNPADVEKDPAVVLGVTRSYPQWLVRRWIGRWGIGPTTELLDAMNLFPPLSLRVNSLKTDADRLKRALEEKGALVKPGGYAPGALQVERPKGAVTEIDGFAEGWFQVQDEAAQLISHLLFPLPGERVLDACAGLGGKSGHLAELMGNRGTLVAADSDGRKLLRLENEMQRLGVTIVTTVASDWTVSSFTESEGMFDRVLVDAPCSGLGVIRRNPDIKWNRDPTDFRAFSKRQGILLDRLSQRVRPGGVLVYAVCSMEPEETDDVIGRFLAGHNDFTPERAGENLHSAVRPFLDDKGCFRTYPHRDGMDGFFAVRLKRS